MQNSGEKAANMSTGSIIDAAERLRALDISTSFCVQAPAGSGKTELLTQRFLKLLAHCERPEEVLAFTFTRKAAAEMRNRLLQSLFNASSLSQIDIAALPPHGKLTHELATRVLKQNQNKGWHLLENTHRLRITTIDSFNAYITSQLPIISEFGSQPEITDDMESIFQAAVQATLSYLEEDSPIADHIATLLQHLDNKLQSVQKLLCNLLRNRDQWLSNILEIKNNPERARDILTANLADSIEENLHYAESLLKPYGEDIMKLIQFASKNLAINGNTQLSDCSFSHELPDISASQGYQWAALASFFLTLDGKLRKSVDIRNGFPAANAAKDKAEKESFKEHKALFTELRNRLAKQSEVHTLLLLLQKIPDKHYDEEQWQVLSALTSVLPFLAAHLDIVFKQQVKVDYIKVSSAALDALGSEDKPTDLAMRLDYQIKHILVDEFQDTSSLQSKFLGKLTRGWEAKDGRTLFIVGDGMQSCYAFRNANVGLFLSARDNGIGPVKLNSLQLKVNFRSESPLVNWVNHIFSQAFPAADNISRGAVSYSQSQAIHHGFKNSGVETLLWYSENEEEISRQQKKRIEAEAVVKQTRQLLSAHPESSIAILVRIRSHLDEIVPALRKAAISWNASDIDSLASYSEINDLLTLTKALLNLADTTALLALLRTPFIGLSLPDIHLLTCKANSSNSSLWQTLLEFSKLKSSLSEDAQLRLQRTIPVLSNSRNNRQRHAIRQWLEGTWIALGGPATLATGTDLHNIETFFQVLEDESKQNDIQDIHRFEEKIGKIYVSGSHSPAVKLHIMTIHNAKGLEFDFVIIPGLDRSPRSDDNALLIWKEHLTPRGEEKLLLSILNRKGGDADPIYQYLKHEAGMRSRLENTRLLYIAITRAAKKTFLLAHLQSTKGKIKAPANSSLLSTIWQHIENPDPEIAVEIRQLEKVNFNSDTKNFSHHADTESISIRRLKSHWRNPLDSHFRPNVNQAPEKNILLKDSHNHQNLPAKRIGDIIHDCLKIKVERNIDLLSHGKLEENWRNRLKPVCVSDNQIKESIATIKRSLKNCIEHPRADWLFSHSHLASSCELPLSDYRHAWRREFIIDRTFIDNENVRWIIDYKSSSVNARQNLEDFLQEQVQLYGPQLENYARLFEAMEDRLVKSALFFTAIPYWHEIQRTHI